MFWFSFNVPIWVVLRFLLFTVKDSFSIGDPLQLFLSCCLLVYLYSCLYFCLYFYLSVECLTICMYVYVSVSLSICLSACILYLSMSVCLSVFLSICLSFVYISICMSVCTYVYQKVRVFYTRFIQYVHLFLFQKVNISLIIFSKILRWPWFFL